MSASRDHPQIETPVRRSAIHVAAGVFIGIGIPLLASSPTVSGIALTIGLVIVLAAPGRLDVLRQEWRALRTPLGLAAAAMFLLWLPSVVTSLDPPRSLEIWARTVGFVLSAALLYHFFRDYPGGHAACLRALIVASVACAVIALLGIHVASPIYGLFRGKGAVEIEAAQYLKSYGSVAACLIPVVLWAGHHLAGVWRYVGYAFVLLGIAVILSVHSNAGLVGLAAALLVGISALALRRTARGWVVLAVVGALAIAAFATVLYRLPALPAGEVLAQGAFEGPAPTAVPTWAVDAHRQTIWAFGRDRFLEAPWIGHGIDISNYLPGADAPVPWVGPQQYLPGHPHSWFLEILMETGVIGIVSLLAALVLLVRAVLRAVPRQGIAGPAAMALFAAFWASSFFNFSVWLSWWQLTFLVLTIIVTASAGAPTSRRDRATQD